MWEIQIHSILLGGGNLTKHEFGIINYLIKDKCYVEYEPEEYNVSQEYLNIN